MSEEKVPEQTLADAEITEVKQSRRKFLALGAAAAGLMGVAMTSAACGADRCDTDVPIYDSDTGSRADLTPRVAADTCDNDT